MAEAKRSLDELSPLRTSHSERSPPLLSITQSPPSKDVRRRSCCIQLTSRSDVSDEASGVEKDDDEESAQAFPGFHANRSRATSELAKVPVSGKLEGYIFKQGGANNAAWKKRWFKLINSRLYYSKDQLHDTINFILLEPTTVVERQNSKYPNKKQKEFGFLIKTSYTARVYYLSCQSQEELDKWIIGLQGHVRSLRTASPVHVDLSRNSTSFAAPRVEPVLDILLMHAELFKPYSGPIYAEVEMKDLTGQTIGRKPEDGEDRIIWNSQFSFESPKGDLIFRVLGKNKLGNPTLIGEVVVSEDDWKEFDQKGARTQAVTCEAFGTILFYLELTTSSSAEGFLYNSGMPLPNLPFRLDAGDIVLFNCEHILSYGTKLFTWSKWDHVGLVVRWFGSELKILEARAEDGVVLFDLKPRIEAMKKTAAIGVRRLKMDRTDEILDKLYQFIKEIKGRPYKRDVMQYYRAATNSSNQEDQSTLFCSQLIAAAYQRMGLLSPEKASNEYLPKDFAEKSTKEFPHNPQGPVWVLEDKTFLKHKKKIKLASSSTNASFEARTSLDMPDDIRMQEPNSSPSGSRLPAQTQSEPNVTKLGIGSSPLAAHSPKRPHGSFDISSRPERQDSASLLDLTTLTLSKSDSAVPRAVQNASENSTPRSDTTSSEGITPRSSSWRLLQPTLRSRGESHSDEEVMQEDQRKRRSIQLSSGRLNQLEEKQKAEKQEQ